MTGIIQFFQVIYEEAGVIGTALVGFLALLLSVFLLFLLLGLLLVILAFVIILMEARKEKRRVRAYLEEHPNHVKMFINNKGFGHDAPLSVYEVNGEAPMVIRGEVYLPTGPVELRVRRIPHRSYADRKRNDMTFREMIMAVLSGYGALFAYVFHRIKGEQEQEGADADPCPVPGVLIKLKVEKSCRYEIKVNDEQNEFHLISIDENEKPETLIFPADPNE